MSKDLLAYRIPNKPSVEQLGSFTTMNGSKKKSIGFILTNFYGNNQFIFESNNQDIFEPSEYAIHLNKNQPTSISEERYIEQGKLAIYLVEIFNNACDVVCGKLDLEKYAQETERSTNNNNGSGRPDGKPQTKQVKLKNPTRKKYLKLIILKKDLLKISLGL